MQLSHPIHETNRKGAYDNATHREPQYRSTSTLDNKMQQFQV